MSSLLLHSSKGTVFKSSLPVSFWCSLCGKCEADSSIHPINCLLPMLNASVMKVTKMNKRNNRNHTYSMREHEFWAISSRKKDAPLEEERTTNEQVTVDKALKALSFPFVARNMVFDWCLGLSVCICSQKIPKEAFDLWPTRGILRTFKQSSRTQQLLWTSLHGWACSFQMLLTLQECLKA